MNTISLLTKKNFFPEKAHSAPQWYLCIRQYTFLWAVANVSGTDNFCAYRGAYHYHVPAHEYFYTRAGYKMISATFTYKKIKMALQGIISISQ
jgi:hypothetical protein